MKNIICSIFSALILFTPAMIWAVPESQMNIIYDLLDSNAYQYKGLIGQNGTALNYMKFGTNKTKGTIVVSPGRTEASVKYLELAYDLDQLGYGPIYVLSHRGQGLSQRVLNNPRKGYVRNFFYYAQDLNQFMDEIVLSENPGKRLYLISHSMGGATAAIYSQNFKSHFHKIIMLAPMLQIELGQQSEREVLWQTTLVCKVPFGPYCTDYIPGGSDGEIRETFEENVVTSSKVRFDFKESLLNRWPELKLGSPTFRWLRESLIATRKLRHQNAISRIQTPILILQAQKDVVVKNVGQDQFCERTPFCSLQIMEQAKHEILFERDEIRNKALEAIENFLSP